MLAEIRAPEYLDFVYLFWPGIGFWPTMDKHRTLHTLVSSLFTENQLKNWTIFEEKSGCILVKLRFTNADLDNTGAIAQSPVASRGNRPSRWLEIEHVRLGTRMLLLVLVREVWHLLSPRHPNFLDQLRYIPLVIQAHRNFLLFWILALCQCVQLCMTNP